MITRDLRQAIARAVAAEGFAPADPGLRSGGSPGSYSSSVALCLPDGHQAHAALGPAGGRQPRDRANALAARLANEPWLAQVTVSGPGFLALTVTPTALAALPERITAAGPACARGDALRGRTLEAPPAADLLTAPGWEEARKALAAELTARLAAAAGAKLTPPSYPERSGPPPQGSPSPPAADTPCRSGEEIREAPEARVPPATEVAAALPSRGEPGIGGAPVAEVAATVASGEGPEGGGAPAGEVSAAVPSLGRSPAGEVAAAIAFAGEDAVRFSLARAMPGRPVRIESAVIARRVPDNPAYAVRYAHARAASGVRWAATLGAEGAPRRPPSYPGELVLLDALSWLPERVAVAARRGRPDEFARYLEELARVTIATLSMARHPGSARAPGSDRLALASAAQTALAAGLGLLGVNAPDRL